MSASTQRVPSIDVVRGVAVVFMIETHLVDACLRWSSRQGDVFNAVSLSNGYVASLFLFCAGGAFALATHKPKRALLRRAAVLLLLGYALHLPELSLAKCVRAGSSALTEFLACDILHVIAMSVAFGVAVLVPLRRRAGLFSATAGLVAAACVLGAAWVRGHQAMLAHGPRWLVAYFVTDDRTRFSLFPWAAVFFAGAALVPRLATSTSRRTLLMVAIACAAATRLAWVLQAHGLMSYDHAMPIWWSLPEQSVFRIVGVVGILCVVLALRVESEQARLLQVMGKESLFVYVLHLLIVYGSVANLGLSHYIGAVLAPLGVAVLVIAVTAFSAIAADAYHLAKRDAPAHTRLVVVAAVSLFIAVFLLAPAS